MPAFTSSIFPLLLLFSPFATASPFPVQSQNLIVYRPSITSPQAGDIWPRGSWQTVTWDTSSLPPQNQPGGNGTGILLLGYGGEGEDGNENLDTDDPLASGFPLADGAVDVVVPDDIRLRDDYLVVLFGDSGNASPAFSITD